MKDYIKPTIEIYSLLGNETICGGCEEKLRDNTAMNGLIARFFPETDPNGDFKLSRDEVSVIFGDGEGCQQEVIGYCKFTSTTSGLSWS